jgi:hypothetical protein
MDIPKDTYKDTPFGNELIKAGRLKSAGTLFCMVGIGLIVTPTLLPDPKADEIKNRKSTNQILVGVGGGLFVIGSLFHLGSAYHIKLAGKEINLQAGRDGVGVKMNLNKN